MKALLAALLSVALCVPASAAVPKEIDDNIFAGVQDIFAMDFVGAQVHFQKAIEIAPEHPYGYYGQAICSWALFVYASQQTDPEQKKKFHADVERAIDVHAAWLKKHPNDADIELSYGGTYGLRSRLHVIEKRWMRALLDGRQAIKQTKLARKHDPELYDALFGIGMYDYYADALPRVVGVFSKLILGGSRTRGMEELKLAAEKGKYVTVGAKLILIEIYTEDQWGAKDPQKALDLIRPLVARFPNSPMFHQIEQVCLYEAGLLDELMANTEKYLARIESKMPYYPESDRARQIATQGTIHFARKDWAAATASYEAAGRLAGTAKEPSRWGVWSIVRLGQIQDLQGARAEAIATYKRAAEFADFWGFRALARGWMRDPFQGAVGQLPPP